MHLFPNSGGRVGSPLPTARPPLGVSLIMARNDFLRSNRNFNCPVREVSDPIPLSAVTPKNEADVTGRA